MSTAERLLSAVVDLQHYIKHDVDHSTCPACPRWDEAQGAAVAAVDEIARLTAELAAATERERVLREWIQEYVVENGCAYGDNCTDEAMRRYRHGRCTACSGRAALGEP